MSGAVRSVLVVGEEPVDWQHYRGQLPEYELRCIASVGRARTAMTPRTWSRVPADAVCIDTTVPDAEAESLLSQLVALTPRPGTILVRLKLSAERLIQSYRFGALVIPYDRDQRTLRLAVAAATERPDYHALVQRVRSRHRLSQSEYQAVCAAAEGLGTSEAALRVGCSVRTLDTHWQRIFNKTGYRSKQEVIALALRMA